jgi:ubiquinone/menaquinone biosynthesis C-methylase UbiE
VLAHFLLKAAWNGTNFSAPVQSILADGGHVLDIGCGAGSWLFDVGSENPAAKFVGLDLAELHPTTIKPANVQFVHANIMNGIPFPDESFDFVYMRHMWTSIPASMWPTVIEEVVRVTRSGGWIEISDPAFVHENRGPFTAKYLEFRKCTNIYYYYHQLLLYFKWFSYSRDRASRDFTF